MNALDRMIQREESREWLRKHHAIQEGAVSIPVTKNERQPVPIGTQRRNYDGKGNYTRTLHKRGV